LGVLRSKRAGIYGNFDDGVEPVWLVVPEGINGPIAGIQVYAVGGGERPEVLGYQNTPCGRIVRANGRQCLTLSGLGEPAAGGRVEQSKRMFEKMEAVLHQAGIDMFSVARTWMWLKDILAWYDDFNRVRNDFFIDHGLITNGISHKMPASTGIGVAAANVACAMELVAVIDPPGSIEYLEVGGNQSSAYDYGSAFSRATKAVTPAGKTVYVSGTASIGADGKTTNIGDSRAQITATIDNVRAVFEEMNCQDSDIVQTIAYCKTAEIEKLFHDEYANLSWPWMTVVSDVCRHDLLFEIEAIAAVAD
jgi:enamine deaminase RidA (YjgF/YER057c/UK114 family)